MDYNELRYQLRARFEELLEDVVEEAKERLDHIDPVETAGLLVDEAIDVLLEHEADERLVELEADETPEEAFEEHRTLTPED